MKYLVSVVLIFSFNRPANAQAVANATIHGVVTDASGAAVPNAQVKAIQTATGQISSSVSSLDGAYALHCR